MSEPTVTRRIRPWIAAVLTIFGWGVGLYYARRDRDAVRFAIASLVIGVILAAAVLALAFYGSDPRILGDPNGWTIVDTINVVGIVIVGAIVWVLASKRQLVEKGGPARLWGYLAIWLIPVVVALLLTFAIRVAWIHPFRQPSGSMQPSIAVGQHFLVSKWSYGYSRFSAAPFESLLPHGRLFAKLPERGDIVVFRPPSEPDRDFVKRIVGLPGDRIQMIAGVLHINGAPVRREPAAPITLSETGESVAVFQETLPNGVSYGAVERGDFELDDTREYVVPANNYFMMGDDRDNSDDSRRSIGFVPFENIIGRVDVLQPLPAP